MREARLEVEPTDGATYTLQLEPGEIIEGRIVPGPGVHLPVKAGVVRLFPMHERRPDLRRWFSYRPDSDSRFRIAGLEPGAWKVAYELYEPGALTPPRHLIVEAGTRNIELLIQRGATVRGFVDVPPGVDPAGLSVLFKDQTGQNSRRGTTDARGAFAIGGLHPQAHGRVTVSIPDRRDRDLYQRSSGYDVLAGTDDVRIQLARAEETTGYLALADRDMTIPRSADVCAYRLGAKGERVGKRPTRQASAHRGSFRLRGLPPGRYDLVLRDARGLRGVAHGVEAGAQHVELRVERRE